MNEYKTYIENLALNKESMIFLNSGPLHAATVMSTIFKFSKKEINIFAGNLNSEISRDKEYIENLQNFLDNDGKLSIILDSYDPNHMNIEIKSLIKRYQFFKPHNINVKSTNLSIIDKNLKNKIHFTVGDKCIYRLEEDTKNYKAKGSFNDSKYCENLNNLFIELLDSNNSHSIVIN